MAEQKETIDEFLGERLIEDPVVIRNAHPDDAHPFGRERLLRNVEASWIILDEHQPIASGHGAGGWSVRCATCSSDAEFANSNVYDALCETRAPRRRYADHPEFDTDWTVTK